MPNDRSPNYPGFSLKTCLEVAQQIYDAERTSWMTHEVAATAMGYSSLSGPPRRKIGALRKFGLLEGAGNNIKLSKLAMTILFATSNEERDTAIREAALRPDLYRELSKETGASDNNLISGLVRSGFIPLGAKRAVASFRETMELIGTKGLDYDLDEEEDESMIDAPAPTTRNSPMNRSADSGGRTTGEFSWPLPQGVTAQLRLYGGPFTKDGLRLLRAYLDLVEQTLPEASVSPTEPQPPSEQSQTDAQD